MHEQTFVEEMEGRKQTKGASNFSLKGTSFWLCTVVDEHCFIFTFFGGGGLGTTAYLVQREKIKIVEKRNEYLKKI